MLTIVIILFALAFIFSIILFKKVGKPYNGLFVIISFLLFNGLLLLKTDKYDVKTQWVSIQKRVDTLTVGQNNLIELTNKIESQQKTIKEIVNETINLIEIERKMPKPAIMWGPELDKESKIFDNKIEEQKVKLRNLTK